MPSLLTWLTTGAITKRLRKSASPASTWFGGTPCRPSAFRVNDRTTKILVKLVVMSSSAGATDRSVMPRSTTIELLGVPLTPLTATETVSPVDGATGAVGAAGSVGAAEAAAAL